MHRTSMLVLKKIKKNTLFVNNCKYVSDVTVYCIIRVDGFARFQVEWFGFSAAIDYTGVSPFLFHINSDEAAMGKC